MSNKRYTVCFYLDGVLLQDEELGTKARLPPLTYLRSIPAGSHCCSWFPCSLTLLSVVEPVTITCGVAGMERFWKGLQGQSSCSHRRPLDVVPPGTSLVPLHPSAFPAHPTYCSIRFSVLTHGHTSLRPRKGPGLRLSQLRILNQNQPLRLTKVGKLQAEQEAQDKGQQCLPGLSSSQGAALWGLLLSQPGRTCEGVKDTSPLP